MPEGIINNHIKSYSNKTVSFNVGQVKEDQDEKGKFAFFEGFASTFGNADLDNDVILPGAFQDTINIGRQIQNGMIKKHSNELKYLHNQKKSQVLIIGMLFYGLIANLQTILIVINCYILM